MAYADPPYAGRAHYYPEREEVDRAGLIARLVSEFPDGWALSVNLAQGMWKYHGCGAKGGPYDAAIAHQHSPRSAIDLLAAYGLAPRRARVTAQLRPPRRLSPCGSLPAGGCCPRWTNRPGAMASTA